MKNSDELSENEEKNDQTMKIEMTFKVLISESLIHS